jgi:hypothetical protein
MDLSRRELLVATATGAALTVCGGGGGTDTVDAPPPSCADNGARSIIPYNHGHILEIPAADIAAGQQRSYDITGGADHSHTVAVTAAEMATLATNAGVQVMSSVGGGHSHTIDLRCR